MAELAERQWRGRGGGDLGGRDGLNNIHLLLMMMTVGLKLVEMELKEGVCKFGRGE